MGVISLRPKVAVSCYICHGTKNAFEGNCITCADVDPAIVRRTLELLSIEQIAFLRFGAHTLARQPWTEEDYKQHFQEFFVEEDDAVYADDITDAGCETIILMPATRHWFAGGLISSGPSQGEDRYFFNYTPLGIHLREALICGVEMI